MISDFIQYISFEKRYSKHTLLAYKADLLQFIDYLRVQYDNQQIEKTDYRQIRGWVVELNDQKMESRSINRKIATLKAYFNFILRKKIIEVDPSLKVKSLKTKKLLPVFAKENEMDLMFENIEFKTDFEGLRDRLVIEILYGTGIRLSELINIKVSDINTYNKTLMVLGKRNKQRIVPIHNELNSLLKIYQSQKNAISSCEFLIITEKGIKTYPMFIQRITKKYLVAATNLKKTSPHILRHTFATHLLNEGADLNAIKDLLGHSSLVATQVYTHNSIKKLQDIHKLAHPKG